eukprot:6172749-Pleurochrysis_carterae.AAC.1
MIKKGAQSHSNELFAPPYYASQRYRFMRAAPPSRTVAFLSCAALAKLGALLSCKGGLTYFWAMDV